MNTDRFDIQIRDLLTLCLTKAIHSAVSVQYGHRWFAEFSAKEAQYEPAKRIVQNGQTRIEQCDLQACLKLLRYREEYSTTVLTTYGFFVPRDPQLNAARSKQFTALLDRLIRDYRNAMDAHTRACDIVRGKDGAERASLYTHQDAVRDMIKLAEILRPVCDSEGVSYHSRMCALRDQWLAAQKAVTYSVSAVLTREQLAADKGTFLQCCESLGIPIVTKEGEVCFTTADYVGDIARVRDRLQLLAMANQKPKKRVVWPWILVILVILVLLAVSSVMLWLLLRQAPESDGKASATDPTTKPTGNVFYDPGNYRDTTENVLINPRYVRWEGGELVAECYIINNLDVSITAIDVQALYVVLGDTPICAGSFGVLEGLTIEGQGYARWTFRFPAETVTETDGRLDQLTLAYEFTYK